MSEIEYLDATCYHAAYGFQHHLEKEIGASLRKDGDLITVAGPQKQAYWTRNIWQKPFILKFDSISQAAKALKNIQRNWAPYSYHLARRTALIAEALPYIPNKPKAFPFDLPQSPMGSFTLLDEHTMLASAQCTSHWPNGEFSFEEDKVEPPSRAYRKLWEALIMARAMPKEGDTCIDAGACPGGWTWVLAKLGAQVQAIDRAPLADHIMVMPGVEFIKHNVFTLKPQDLGPVDWLFSDVICYPGALYDWISLWLDSGMARNFVCTIKMQGETWDQEATNKFAQIPGSKVMHLWHNKHELTWMLIREKV